MSTQEKLKQIVAEANEKYRRGEDSGLTDSQYDDMLEQIADEEFKNKVGAKVTVNKTELPVGMGSMSKLKEFTDMTKWFDKLEGSTPSEKMIITPKYDGLALLVEFVDGKFSRAITRGDGTVGQDVTEHYQNTKLSKVTLPYEGTVYVIGETIMSNQIFEDKYSTEYKNPRNLVSGIIGKKHVSEKIRDLHFLAFDLKFPEDGDTRFVCSKSERLNIINQDVNNFVNGYRVPFLETKKNAISENQLNMFKETVSEYNCDGVVIDVDDADLRNRLGLETNSLNPKFARAWKPQVEETAAAVITNIKWNTNKTGKITPVVEIAPVELGGVTISNVTAYNAAFVQDNELQVGTVVKLCRSGDVIPRLLEVITQPDHY